MIECMNGGVVVMGNDEKRRKSSKKEPTVAAGYSDEVFGEKATPEDIRKGNYTRVTRVNLDENDPS